MPNSLLLDGVDDYIRFTAGGADGLGSFTVVVAAKLVADEAAYKNFVGLNASDSLFGTNNLSPHNLAAFYAAGGGAVSTFTAPASDGWCIYAYGRDNDSTGRFHKYVFDTDTWTHEANGSFLNEGAITDIWIGRTGDNQSYMDANFLIAGWWNSNLSDGAIEALESTTASWVAAAPAELYRFDTLGAITSLTGTSTEAARVGTSLDPGDAPNGWVDITGSVRSPSYSQFPKAKLRPAVPVRY